MTPDHVDVFERPEGHRIRATLRLLRMGRLDPTWQLEDGVVRHAMCTPEGTVSVQFEERERELVVSTWGAGSGWVAPRLRGWAGLDDTPQAFQSDHPRIRPLMQRVGVPHMPQVPLISETLVTCVLQQRVTYKEAARSWRLMAMSLGEEAPGPFRLRTGPRWSRLIDIGYAGLHPLGMEQKRANLIRFIAGRVAWFEGLRAHDLTTQKRLLYKVPGLGPWTINMLAGNGLGDADAVPLGDYSLPHTVAWLLEKKARSDDSEMVHLLAPFRPHRWRLLTLTVLAGVQALMFGPRRKSGWIPGA